MQGVGNFDSYLSIPAPLAENLDIAIAPGIFQMFISCAFK